MRRAARAAVFAGADPINRPPIRPHQPGKLPPRVPVEGWQHEPLERVVVLVGVHHTTVGRVRRGAKPRSEHQSKLIRLAVATARDDLRRAGDLTADAYESAADAWGLLATWRDRFGSSSP